jgi:hypothetical protein
MCLCVFQSPLIVPTTERKNAQMSRCGELALGMSSTLDCSAMNQDEWRHVSISNEESVELEQSTRSQINSSTWHTERNKRITSSKFGHIMNRKAPVTDTFIRNTHNPKPFTSTATTYGIKKENTAKEEFLKLHPNAHLHSIGLVVNPTYPFLGASPDGRVCLDNETGILEIKCPFSVRQQTIEDACNRPDFCLEQINDTIQLKRTHLYWHQVQGQLLVTSAQFCIFVVYTEQDIHIEKIVPDTTTMQNLLNKLYSHYILHAKHYLATIRDNAILESHNQDIESEVLTSSVNHQSELEE